MNTRERFHEVMNFNPDVRSGGSSDTGVKQSITGMRKDCPVSDIRRWKPE